MSRNAALFSRRPSAGATPTPLSAANHGDLYNHRDLYNHNIRFDLDCLKANNYDSTGPMNKKGKNILIREDVRIKPGTSG